MSLLTFHHRPLNLGEYPRAILHLDGDAFFVACEQATHPELRDQPVVTGGERGCVTACSYQAKALGITRGQPLYQVAKQFPQVRIVASDFETYNLYSQRFFNWVRKFTPEVEEYSIDECFADLTGLRRLWRQSYPELAQSIQRQLNESLGITFSAGLASTKVLAKVASNWSKPVGLTCIPGIQIHRFLRQLSTDQVWGIGAQTAALLKKYGIRTALDLARRDQTWINKYLAKPQREIWQELNGNSVLDIDDSRKTTYASIQRSKTFYPSTDRRSIVLAQLSRNIEKACHRARHYRLAPQKVSFWLKDDSFVARGVETKLSMPTNIPSYIVKLASTCFQQIYQMGTRYRATGVTLNDLQDDHQAQLDLFQQVVAIDQQRHLYQGIDALNKKYGQHKIMLGTTLAAYTSEMKTEGQEAKRPLLVGESQYKRLEFPLITGQVNEI